MKDHINRMIKSMHEALGQVAIAAEQVGSASASEEMSAQAQELNGMIAEFKLNQSGRKQIAKAGPRQQVKKIDHTKKPEAIIPMEDDKKTKDDDFKDF